MRKYLAISAMGVWSLLAVRCSIAPLAGGSDNPDFKVIGVVTNKNGKPAPGTQVMILPGSYNLITDREPVSGMIDTTDSSGRYHVAVACKGSYNIQAVNLRQRTRLLISGVPVSADTTLIAGAPLSVPGAVKVTLPPNVNNVTGYVYVPGTTILTFLNESSESVELDSVPAGVIPAIAYSSINSAEISVIRYSIPVTSATTAMVNNPQWKYAQKLVLNTTATGADVAGDVVNFPVLIRLNAGDFDFSQAQAAGADLRFTKSDNTFLACEIERWDAANKTAELWVKVDTIRGDDSQQSLTMYWGNPDAVAASNAAAVFDTAVGFAGVWHLGKPAGGIVADATANGNSATATTTATVAGAVGNAQSFDGKSSFIRTIGPAGDKLNFSENGNYSVSAWVNTKVLGSSYHGIIYKSNFEYGLQIFHGNSWEFFTFIDKTGWEGSRSPASTDSWHFLSGVRQGSRQYLYLDGVCVDSTKALLTSNLSRVYNNPVEIGHCSDGGLDPDRYFSGAIDEVRISSVANSADWIKLCYMNQKEQDVLVKR